MSNFILAGILTAVLTFLFTFLIRNLACHYKIFDFPNLPRKIHKKNIPLLGGLAVFLGFSLVLVYFTLFTDQILGGYMLAKHVFGLLLAGAILIFGGILDDKFNLKPYFQFIFPVLAVLVIIASGIGISYISNPFGQAFDLEQVKIKIFHINQIPYHLVLWSDLFTFFWLLGMIYTTKFLDGLDGLVSGITVIGSVILFFLSLNPNVMQPETALICIILAGSALGFLFWNFYPAKIFLGEGGSTFFGFTLGTLAIISGGKIATALLIMGIPILDAAWVILRRLFRKKSPFIADKKHLHFRLLDIGFHQRDVVLFLWFLSLSFGSLALLFQGKAKIFALGVLVIVMILLALLLIMIYKRKKIINKTP